MAIAFVGSASGTATSNPTMSVHANTATGDLIVAVVTSGGLSQDTSWGWPSGWTEITTPQNCTSTAVNRTEWRYRFREAGDSTYVFTGTSATTQGGYIWATLVYSGVHATTPILQQAAGTQTAIADASSIVTATVTDSTADVWRIAAFSASDTASTDYAFSGYSPADTERVQVLANFTRETALAVVDSNATVNASGGTSVTAEHNASTLDAAIDWIALIQPAGGTPGNAPAGLATATATANDATVAFSWPSGISFIAAEGHTHGENTDFTITKPSGTAENDVMITVVSAVGSNGGIPAFTMADWTELDTETTTLGSDGRTSVYYRVAGASEPGSWTGSRTQGSTNTACAVVTATYRNVDTASPFIGNSSAGAADPGTLSSGVVNSAVATCWAVGLAGGVDNSTFGLDRSAGAPTTNHGGVQSLDTGGCTMAGLWDSNGQAGTGDLSFTAAETGSADWISSFIAVLRASSGASTNANAGTATATATASDTAFDYAPAGTATATATASDTAFDYAPAGTATATATANNATASLGALSGHVAASGAASDTAFDYAPAGATTGASAASPGSSSLGANAGSATGTALAGSVTASIGQTGQAGETSATAVASDATVFIGETGHAGEVAGSATAFDTAFDYAPTSAVTGAVVANDATVSTVVERNAPAGEVAVAATASNSSVLLKALAGTPTATAVANGATVSGSGTAQAGHATATATANDTAFDKAPAGQSSATAVSNGVTALIGETGHAGSVAATAAANGAKAAVAAQAGHATATATANDTAFDKAPAGAVTATAVALDATVSTTSFTNAPAGTATATTVAAAGTARLSSRPDHSAAMATAHNAMVRLGVAAGTAVVFGSAGAGTGRVGPLAGQATAGATASGSSTASTANAGQAGATATASGVSLSPAAEADGGTATATAVVDNPTVRARFHGGLRIYRRPERRGWWDER